MKFVIISTIFIIYFSNQALSKDCGIPAIPADLNVTLGTTQAESWPWEAMIQYKYEPWCASTLIAPNWALTTAKCIHRVADFAKNSIIMLGQKQQAVDSVVVHPYYVPSSAENDIALVKLKSEMTGQQRACLPKTGSVASAGQRCFVVQQNIEWSSDRANIRYDQRRVKVMENAECKRVKATQYFKSVKDSILCAANDGSQGPFHGLLGGSLVCQSGSGSWAVQGITSWLFHNAALESYTAFSRATHYLNWINNTIGNK